MKDLTRIVEALLFAAEGPLRVPQVLEAVPEATEEAVEEALTTLQDHYDNTGRAFCLVPIAGGHQLVTRSDLSSWVERFLVGRRRQRLSRAALEVLAVVAYRQPVTRGDVEAIRGVDCGGVLRTLLERQMARVKGRAKSVGHPLLYVTTDHFLEHFGVADIKELPRLEEFEALLDPGEARAELVESGLLMQAIMPETVGGQECPPETTPGNGDGGGADA